MTEIGPITELQACNTPGCPRRWQIYLSEESQCPSCENARIQLRIIYDSGKVNISSLRIENKGGG